jgi:hypothetical protein
MELICIYNYLFNLFRYVKVGRNCDYFPRSWTKGPRQWLGTQGRMCPKYLRVFSPPWTWGPLEP